MAARSRSSSRTTSSSPTSARPRSSRPMVTTRSTSPSAPPARPIALAMLPVAEEYKKILIVEPAVADQITGDKWNRYIFRTARNSSQDALAAAATLKDENISIATLAQDNAFGKDGIASLKEALVAVGSKAKVVHEEYTPAQTDRLHRLGPAPVRRAEGQARPQDHRRGVGRRPSAAQADGPQAGALQDRDRAGRQHPAGDGRLEAVPRPRGRDLLLLGLPQEPGERLARHRIQEEEQRRAAGLLRRGRHGRRHGGGRGGQEGGRHRHREADRRDGRHGASTRPRAR